MTISTAKADLYALLTDDPETGAPNAALTGLVERVYRGEPRPGDTVMPVAVTILTRDMDAIDITFALNIYASTATDALGVQDVLDETIEAVEGCLDASDQFNRGQWTVGYFPNLDVFVATCTMTTGREDFGGSQHGA
jgi:hypothetical protein